MKVCFNRFVKICTTKKCPKDYERYGNHIDLKCPEGLGYKEEEIPDLTTQSKIEYILKKDIK